MPHCEPPELEATAEYWLNIAETELVCEAWAVDQHAEIYGYASAARSVADDPKRVLAYASFIGDREAVNRVRIALRRGNMIAHIVSSDPQRWRTGLDASPLRQCLTFSANLPEAGLRHCVAMPNPNADVARGHDAPVRGVYYAFPETPERLAPACGDILRRYTSLLCPPQWDQELLEICQRLEVVWPLESSGVSAWGVRPDCPAVQDAVSRAVAAGRLRLDPD